MPLANQVLEPLPVVPNVAFTCHVAVWFWAAQEAQARGLTSTKAPLATLQRIAGMPGGPQGSMLVLTIAGAWDFGITGTTPMPGTVLIWTGGATHSAVVAAANQIRGYNQVAQFPAITDTGVTTGTPTQLGVGHRQVVTVSENTIVTVAGNLGL